MNPFSLKIGLFQSKLGRKFLTVFVCCALLPILILSGVTYSLVAQQMETQAKSQLQRAAKSYGFTIYDRLLLVEAQLQLLALSSINSQNSSATLAKVLDASIGDNLAVIALLRRNQRAEILMGRTESLPKVSPEIWSNLARGKSGIIAQPYTGAEGHRIFLVRAVSSQEALDRAIMAEIKPQYLWSLGDANPLPPMTEFCVLDSNNHILFSTISFLDPKLKQISEGVEGIFIKENELDGVGHQHVLSAWTLFMKHRFQEPGWKIILSQSNEQILRPIHNFRRAFLLSTLLTFWIILLLSIRYIRKSLVPMEKIKVGTRRILNGDFNTPLEHHSGDEFDDLINSFNRMSFELGRQVEALRMIAKIGRKTAGITDPQELLDVELALMKTISRFNRILVFLSDSNQEVLKCEAWRGVNSSEIESLPSGGIDIKKLSDQDIFYRTFVQKESLLWQPPEAAAGPLSSTDQLLRNVLDAETFFCVPIIYENHSLGVIVVEGIGDKPLSESDQELIKGIATQTASGILNGLSVKKLKNSEEHFRRIFNNAAAGMALFDINGNIVKANTRFGEILGYSSNQLHGRHWQEISHPEDIDITQRVAERIQSDHGRYELYEKRYLHRDGRAVSVLISTSLLRDEAGQLLYYISHIQDLSHQKAAEAEKKEIEHRLIQSQKMEAMGTLAGGIAHDFNNLISAIMGQAELGILQIEDTGTNKGRFEGILRAAHRSKALVQQILTFSRQSDHKKQAVSIRELATEAAELLRASLPANITIEANFDIEKDRVLADANQIHQVLMNLGTNAYHAMIEKGGTLTMTLENENIGASDTGDGTASHTGKHIKINIADTGTGISPEHLEKIFDPYFTTKEKGKGTGLGLAMVHGIIKEHQGSINVRSQKGKGSVFEILLPQLEGETAADSVIPNSIKGGVERILFVDDESILVELGTDMLRYLGYQVDAYRDPIEALELLRADPQKYDLVITDFNMPKMDGDALAREIEVLAPDMPLILCSGYQEWQHSRSDLPTVLKAVLPKPFTTSELAVAIRKVLGETHP